MNYLNEILDQLNVLLSKTPYSKTIFLSVLLILFYFVFKKLVHSSIDKRKGNKHFKQQLKKRSTMYLTYFFILCLLFVWFAQLQVFFVSILAVAAAIVIALKELIMCLTGGTLIQVSNVFKVGHRIDVDGARGFVLEKNLLTTKILEVGPEKNSQQTTGDIITIPNSLMLSKMFKNESYFKGYSIKSFIFKIQSQEKITDFEKGILEKASSFCAPYLEEAKKNISTFCEKEGILVPSLDPKTKIIVEDGKIFSVLVKLPVRNTELADIEQELNRFFLKWRIENKEVYIKE